LSRDAAMKVFFLVEVTMRKMTLVAIVVVLIAAGIGIRGVLVHVAATPETSSTGAPAIAAMSPIEVMKDRGRGLPSSQNGDPF
jgi:hypothetical protein